LRIVISGNPDRNQEGRSLPGSEEHKPSGNELQTGMQKNRDSIHFCRFPKQRAFYSFSTEKKQKL